MHTHECTQYHLEFCEWSLLLRTNFKSTCLIFIQTPIFKLDFLNYECKPWPVIKASDFTRNGLPSKQMILLNKTWKLIHQTKPKQFPTTWRTISTLSWWCVMGSRRMLTETKTIWKDEFFTSGKRKSQTRGHKNIAHLVLTFNPV